jgi:hypothetical protein
MEERVAVVCKPAIDGVLIARLARPQLIHGNRLLYLDGVGPERAPALGTDSQAVCAYLPWIPNLMLLAMGGRLLMLDRDHEQLGLLEDRRAGDVSKGALSNKVGIVLGGVAAAGSCKAAGGDLAFGGVEIGRGGRVGQLQ